MDKKKVIIVADIHDSLPSLNPGHRQEWESQASIDFLITTISSLGYDSELVEPKKSKIKMMDRIKNILEEDNIENTILFNLVEGFTSRNREGYIPSLGEFLGIPFTGSDAYAQAISLDKNLVKLIVKNAKIPTKNFYCIEDIQNLPLTIRFPIFLKPNGEGSSLGISSVNIIRNRKELEFRAQEILAGFGSVLIEDFLSGDDLTLGVFGNYPNYQASAVAKIIYPDLVYSEEVKTKDSMPESLAFCMPQRIGEKIQKDSIHICKILKVSGYARLDWKCDEFGNPFFLEINLTPGLSAYYSSLPICYEESFGIYSDLIKKVLQFGYENYNTNKIFNYGRLEKKIETKNYFSI